MKAIMIGKNLVCVGIAVFLAVGTLMARESSAAELQPLRATYAAISGNFAPIWLAYDKGLFGKYGLNVDLRFMPPSTATQALLGRSVEMIIPGGEFIEAGLAGEKVTYVAAIANKVVLSLYSKPEVQGLSDLRGKVISALSPGSTSEFLVRVLLREANLVPGKDVKLLYLKSGPEIFAALAKGTIDAGVMSAPMTLKARQSGFKELFNGAKRDIPMIHAALGTRKDFVAANRDQVRRYLQAYLEGIKLAKTRPDDAKAVIQKYTKTGQQDELSETYDTFVGVWEKIPYVSTAAVQTLLDFASHPRAKNATPADFIDNSILSELEKSGFVAGLYK